jgi:sugar diacid utilization regulator
LATAGNGVLIGVSNDVVSTSQIPGAYRQALLALHMTGLARRVVPFSQVALQQLMIQLAGDQLAPLLPGWSGAFHRADDQLSGALSATLRAYAEADMNLLKAAARLAVHPNTVYARLNRIRDITGLNARAFHPLCDLLTVADARQPAWAGGSVATAAMV